MTEANIERSAEERLAEIEETRRKNRERQQKHRRDKKEAEPLDEEKRYRESPQFYWDTNLENLKQNYPVEYAQVRSIEAEYKRIQAAIHEVVEKVPEFHKPALLRRKEREVPDVAQLYKDLKKFQAANYYYPNIISQPGYPAGGRAVDAPGAEFCQTYTEASPRDIWNCYGIFLWFDLYFIREFLQAAIFHLLVEGTPDQEMLRRMIEELKEDVVRGFADRHKEEMLCYYPSGARGDEAIYNNLGLRMQAFLAGEPFIPPSVEQPKRGKPEPVIIQLPDTYGASFPITPRGEL
jgi:hypothetical protein